QMLGEVEKDRLVLKTQAQPGDDIILTKGIAIEGTAIIARERGPELIKTFGQDMVKRAQNFLYEPGISIIREALLAARAARVHAMHDLTEGGLATGVLEMAQIAGLGVTINKDRIRCYPETESLCSHYGLNPLGLIASGALLIALDPKDTQRVLDALRKEGIQAEAIGSLTEEKKGFRILEDKEAKELPFFQVDEIARLFEAEGKKSSALPR
ncbi:MAG TPA: AIR synthase-related protein, partial [Candidatus Hypogeohydataceae bacterium YC38]